MAHCDWKRYYAVIVEDWAGRIRLYQPQEGFYRTREQAEIAVGTMRLFTSLVTPMGIAAIRGRKDNPSLQRWLLEHSQ